MTGIVAWAGNHARMVLAFIALTLLAGGMTYATLPKEGEPDIEIPALFVSVPFPGISAEDSEKLLVKPMETELSDIDGLKTISGTAAENYAGVALEFEFGWNKTEIIADVRDRMNTVEAKFPAGADKYSINEINFSEFPIIIVNLTGDLPERTLIRVAKELQDRLEGLEPILEASIAGSRDEMVEVLIDPLKLESYNVTAGELINVVRNNNQLIAAGEIESAQGAFSVKIPSSFNDIQDVYSLPVKVNGDSIITLADLADIRLTFEDRSGTARYNGETTVALQVVKRKGFNIIDTADLVRAEVEKERETWPPVLQQAISVGTSSDQSTNVKSMVNQLEGAVLTAIALVMIVILASLGARSALLVGFAIPTSFLLCFILLGVMGITISNIVMFGLILAVGMLVDGAIVVVEYADRRISEGVGPMHAFVESATRMFWPIVSSTATTLCAFLPMLFWPGVAGQFMGMLPVTLIFVLSASLIVALIYLPVMGGVAGRLTRVFDGASETLRNALPWVVRAALVPIALYMVFIGAMQTLNPGYIFGGSVPEGLQGAMGAFPGMAIFLAGVVLSTITVGAARIQWRQKRIKSGYRRTAFGHFTNFIAGNPIMPIVVIIGVGFAVMSTFSYYGEHNNGTEFISASEPELGIVYVRARGNLSVAEKDVLVREVEKVVIGSEGVESAFAFAGAGGLNQNTGGASGPSDSIGQIQLELTPWEDRKDNPDLNGNIILDNLKAKIDKIPGIKSEILRQSNGPASAKPVHLRLKGDNFESLVAATAIVRAKFDETAGLTQIEDTRPLPGIDWEVDVDVEKAGRFGTDVATVGGMVQLVTRGILLDTMRVDSSDEEIEIRVRLPEKDRVLSTLESLKVRTNDGLIPLSNFISWKPVKKLGQIDRVDQSRYFDVKAGVAEDMRNANDEVITASERVAYLTDWLETENPLPADVAWEWTGDQEDQAESQQFLSVAFTGALGLMFIILLAQFNSFYNSVLVLMAVVMSTAGVLIGMLVMGQSFSIIMTGVGIVALAGIVVNNNIVLIDTYQEYSQYMPKIEAIVRTAETRIRPVLLTTITTMAGLAPMMYGLSLDFFGGGYSIDSPTASFWKQLATAVVFGLGIATVLTLIFTPAMLALRVWVANGAYFTSSRVQALARGRKSRPAMDISLQSAARKLKQPEIIWDVDPVETATEPTAEEATPTAPVEPATDPLKTVEDDEDNLAAPTDPSDPPKPSLALTQRAQSLAAQTSDDSDDPLDGPLKKKRKPGKKKKPPLRAAE
ncbi:MAG: efflux RND transporter permease subunit [Marinosulfonomonas sp.]